MIKATMMAWRRYFFMNEAVRNPVLASTQAKIGTSNVIPDSMLSVQSVSVYD